MSLSGILFPIFMSVRSFEHERRICEEEEKKEKKEEHQRHRIFETAFAFSLALASTSCICAVLLFPSFFFQKARSKSESPSANTAKLVSQHATLKRYTSQVSRERATFRPLSTHVPSPRQDPSTQTSAVGFPGVSADSVVYGSHFISAGVILSPSDARNREFLAVADDRRGKTPKVAVGCPHSLSLSAAVTHVPHTGLGPGAGTRGWDPGRGHESPSPRAYLRVTSHVRRPMGGSPMRRLLGDKVT